MSSNTHNYLLDRIVQLRLFLSDFETNEANIITQIKNTLLAEGVDENTEDAINNMILNYYQQNNYFGLTRFTLYCILNMPLVPNNTAHNNIIFNNFAHAVPEDINGSGESDDLLDGEHPPAFGTVNAPGVGDRINRIGNMLNGLGESPFQTMLNMFPSLDDLNQNDQRDVPRVLKEDTFNGLKQCVYEDIKKDDVESKCVICLSNYEDKDAIVNLPCNHYYHKGCIKSWVRGDHFNSILCPICRKPACADDEYETPINQPRINNPLRVDDPLNMRLDAVFGMGSLFNAAPAVQTFGSIQRRRPNDITDDLPSDESDESDESELFDDFS
jgi:hypothetical protein